MYKGRCIVITGGANGIGRALAQFFLDKGAHVAVLDLAQPEDFAHEKLLCLEANVCKPDSLEAAAKTVIDTFGPISFWFNNAGVSGLGGFEELSSEEFDQVIAINLGGVISGSRTALRVMQEAGFGSIINIASVAGLLPAPFMSAYNASKHGVVGFTRSLRLELELRKSPVKVITVCPGFVETAIINKGSHLGFPEWLSFLLSTPEQVITEIDRGLRRGSDEIFPTFNGKLMRALYKVFPRTTSRSSRILLTRSLKDLLLNKLHY